MFQKFKRKGVSEMRPVTEAEVLAGEIQGVSISDADKKAGSPKPGDQVARNPENHEDQWLVAAKWFDDNYEPVLEEPSTFLDRLEVEKRELDIKVSKLLDFLFTKAYDKLSEHQKSLLRIQAETMEAYSQVLCERIVLVKQESQEPIQENPEDSTPLKFKDDAEKGAPITDDFLYMVHGGGWLDPEKFLEPEDAKKVRDAINLIVRYEEEGIENGYFEEI